MKWTCLNCGKEHEDFPYLAKKRKYCNSSCQLKYEYKTGKRDSIKITEKAHQTIRERGHYKRDNSYLSNPNHMSKEAKERMSKSRMGEGNPMFGKIPWHKMTPTKKWWEEKEFIQNRKLVMLRDNYACVKCGEFNKDVYCDHIIPYRISKNHDLENLQMLCGSCHSKKTIQDIKNFPELRAGGEVIIS